MQLTDTDFQLFGVPQRFAQDRAVLDARWRELQSEVHPDRFSVEGPAAQRVAMQWSLRVNEAYQRLKDPLRRAAYLCELRGVAIDAENNTAMPADFLEQQMQWREALAEARTLQDVEDLAGEVVDSRRALLLRLGSALDEAGDTADAARLVRALMFVERFAEQIDQRLEALGQ